MIHTHTYTHPSYDTLLGVDGSQMRKENKIVYEVFVFEVNYFIPSHEGCPNHSDFIAESSGKNRVTSADSQPHSKAGPTIKATQK